MEVGAVRNLLPRHQVLFNVSHWFLLKARSDSPAALPSIDSDTVSSSLVLGSVTYLKAISTKILEKNGVVTGFPGLGNFMSGSFDVPRPRTSSNLSQPINLAGAVSPERDAALVGHMLRRLGNAENSVTPSASADSNCNHPS